MKIIVRSGDKEITYEENQEVTNYLKITNPDYHKMILDAVEHLTKQVVLLDKS